jgi:hypothetical protein
MTLAEFRVDEQSLKKDLRHSPETADPAVLGETYFVMPVRLSINEVELLQGIGPKARNSDPWLPLPVLGSATDMLEGLQEMGLHGTRKISLAGSGTLYLARERDRLSLTCSLNEKTVTTNVVEVIDAFRDFLDKVRAMLVSQVPAMMKHPFWDQWFSRFLSAVGQGSPLPLDHTKG